MTEKQFRRDLKEVALYIHNHTASTMIGRKMAIQVNFKGYYTEVEFIFTPTAAYTVKVIEEDLN